MILIVDASVAVKWVLPEADSERAAALRKPGDDLVAPSLVAAEIGNALWKSAMRGDIGKSEATAALPVALAHFALLVPVEELVTRAIELAINLRNPIYDCFYLALAERERASLVSADARLLDAARRMKGIEARKL
jgi:predicted nucleic acid-binding protein